MSDFTKLAEQYIATWNETDPSARRALIDEVWAVARPPRNPHADGREKTLHSWGP